MSPTTSIPVFRVSVAIGDISVFNLDVAGGIGILPMVSNRIGMIEALPESMRDLAANALPRDDGIRFTLSLYSSGVSVVLR
jgi:hypothetical protein